MILPYTMDGTSLLTKAVQEGVERVSREGFRYSKAEVCSGQVLPDTDYGDHAACCSIAIGDR